MSPRAASPVLGACASLSFPSLRVLTVGDRQRLEVVERRRLGDDLWLLLLGGTWAASERLSEESGRAAPISAPPPPPPRLTHLVVVSLLRQALLLRERLLLLDRQVVRPAVRAAPGVAGSASGFGFRSHRISKREEGEGSQLARSCALLRTRARAAGREREAAVGVDAGEGGWFQKQTCVARSVVWRRPKKACAARSSGTASERQRPAIRSLCFVAGRALPAIPRHSRYSRLRA